MKHDGESLRLHPATAAAGRRMPMPTPGRLAAVALVTLLLSLRALVSPALLDFFTPAEIALAWLEYVVELGVIAAALLLGYSAADAALPRAMPWRLGAVCAVLLALSAVLAVLLHAYYAAGFEHLPPPLRILADALRWGLPAVFLASIAEVHRRALQADSAASAADVARAQLRQAESEQQLALLQAQIEPHFLFNVLGNVRSLYRTEPQAGAGAIDSLMRYLRAALPQLRSRRASLGEELALVRAYLELFQLRMGGKMAFSINADTSLNDIGFPPMLLVTLVENAIKHGLEPAGGGRIEVRARRVRGRVEVEVLDDGAGFGTAPGSGTGVGLVNVRRQLQARYAGRARLTLEARRPRGARAAIELPSSDDGGGRVPLGPAEAVDPALRLRAAPPDARPAAAHIAAFAAWIRGHPSGVAMAGLLAFAGPMTFLTGTLGVVPDQAGPALVDVALWWALYGLCLWAALLVLGYAGLRLAPRLGRTARLGAWLVAAAAASGIANLVTGGRATLLLQLGLVHSAQTMHAHGLTVSLIMALLYFAYLSRSEERERATARLAHAQAAQRHLQRGIAQARLQEVQSRIDPRMLFGMFEIVRSLYRTDPARAESFLDELIAFLRALLPRLRSASSSLAREAELAGAFVRLHALGAGGKAAITSDIAGDAAHSRFPPGVLLPLLDRFVDRGGTCRLTGRREDDRCWVTLTMDVAPTDDSLARVRSLLAELYGAAARIELRPAPAAIDVLVKVPYEHA